MLKYRKLLCALVCLASAAVRGEDYAYESRWSSMDYGPFLSLTLNQGLDTAGRDNSTVKALVVRSSCPECRACIAYDTELMRVAGAWSGGFIDYNGITFNGSHNAQPKALGTTHFASKHTPGWAIDGNFNDPRAERRGPMPRDWMHYNGLYRHNRDVVLSYSVGDCNVLEMPVAMRVRETQGVEFDRIFNLSPTKKSLSLLVFEMDFGAPIVTKNTEEVTCADCETVRWPSEYMGCRMQTQGAPPGSAVETRNGRVIIKLPPLKKPLQFSVRTLAVPNGVTFISEEGNPRDLSKYTKGGPALWTEEVVTHGERGYEAGAYAVDTLQAPIDNPWHSWLRFSGVDFFPDGRAALCTLSGDVWIVSGIDNELAKLTWKRFATGLHEPMGLKIVDNTIYVTGRNQITRLHDLDNDGEADFYENFNSDCMVTYNYHEFACDLQTDAQGNFYFAKASAPGTQHTLASDQSPHNGAFLKLSKDGKKLEVLAHGLRVPNGVAVGPNGELTCSDNEGAWIPQCPLNEIHPGAFYGYLPSADKLQPRPEKREAPVMWLPWKVDNSSSGQVWVEGNRWGPYEKHLVQMSYGMSSVFVAMIERVNGQAQGAMVKLPLNFNSGLMRGKFDPLDGQLYVCGLRGWQTNAARDCAFQRVRYTGKPVALPTEFHVKRDGIELKFAEPLNRNEAEDATNYSAWWYDVKWNDDDRAARYSPTNPRRSWDKHSSEPPGEDLRIRSVKLGEDKRTVKLFIPGLKPVSNIIIRTRIESETGEKIRTDVYGTINALP